MAGTCHAKFVLLLLPDMWSSTMDIKSKCMNNQIQNTNTINKIVFELQLHWSTKNSLSASLIGSHIFSVDSQKNVVEKDGTACISRLRTAATPIFTADQSVFTIRQ